MCRQIPSGYKAMFSNGGNGDKKLDKMTDYSGYKAIIPNMAKEWLKDKKKFISIYDLCLSFIFIPAEKNPSF